MATEGLSAQERAAVKQRAADLRAETKRAKAADKAALEAAEQAAKIDQLPDGDREMAQRLQSIVAQVAPSLTPKLYYGQPGWAAEGKVVFFFRSGQQDKLRYSTFGVSPAAALDAESGLWPTSYALINPTEDAWTQLAELIRRAAPAAG